jgi:hypothetical protein
MTDLSWLRFELKHKEPLDEGKYELGYSMSVICVSTPEELDAELELKRSWNVQKEDKKALRDLLRESERLSLVYGRVQIQTHEIEPNEGFHPFTPLQKGQESLPREESDLGVWKILNRFGLRGCIRPRHFLKDLADPSYHFPSAILHLIEDYCNSWSFYCYRLLFVMYENGGYHEEYTIEPDDWFEYIDYCLTKYLASILVCEAFNSKTGELALSPVRKVHTTAYRTKCKKHCRHSTNKPHSAFRVKRILFSHNDTWVPIDQCFNLPFGFVFVNDSCISCSIQNPKSAIVLCSGGLHLL